MSIDNINRKNAYTRLLAIMAKADDKVIKIENLNVYAVLEALEGEGKFNLRQDYREMLSTNGFEESAIGALQQLPVSDRLEVIRSCWLVAICDGEFHPEEERFFLKLIEKSALPQEEAEALYAQIRAHAA